MTTDPTWALQQAIYAALHTNAGLIALCGDGGSPARAKVYDDGAVPQGTQYPYVIIGETTGLPSDTKSSKGDETTFTLHVWSRAQGDGGKRGQKECRQIMGAVVAALDGQSLTVSGFTLIDISREFSTSFLDADGLSRHGVVRFRAKTEEP